MTTVFAWPVIIGIVVVAVGVLLCLRWRTGSWH